MKMSADSPHRTRSQPRVSGERVTVSPQQVTDPTILDSVAGFINDVVPNTYNVQCDTKDQIQWAHFEQLESEDLTYLENVDCDKIIPPPLLLVLGYTFGIQVWIVPASSEAFEVLSWRHGSVRVLKVLPTPSKIGNVGVDLYASKRPLIALCDDAAPGPHYCSLSFISLKTGEQTKVIKFKNPLLEVLANRRSVVVTFAERIAVFDAFTLEDRLTVTTCYLSPGIYPNPVALGTRWMAYAENRLISSRRSSGGNDGEGVQSYTATVLHAAKSLGRGLRELGETVASSLTGNVQHKPGALTCHVTGSGQTEILQKGVVTVLDIESSDIDVTEKTIENEAFIAHFTAHTEAIVCLRFDPSGLLLLTADKSGHDFHLFRIHPHPGGPSLAAVHHLYVLHRGDTTARVQDMCFSPDSRWVTVSTLRGTTHVFPITPYGGPVGVRTHATPHVVNRMSRFHRSAGLTAEGRSNSPVSLFEAPINSNSPYHNPRMSPYPHPTVAFPLAQIRQPVYIQNSGSAQQRPHSGRQRLSSSSEDNIQVVLRVCVCFAAPRAWIDKLTQPKDASLNKPTSKPVESLFIMSCHGSLVQYDLDPQHIASISKEKVCDDTPIELSVFAKAQWILQRQPNGKDVQLPLPNDYLDYFCGNLPGVKKSRSDHTDDRWLSQVEIVTHAGPHRRLWMGPQFTFKTYNANSGSCVNILESKLIDVGRSKPVNMPMTGTYPVLIESGSVSSCEPSPKLLETCQRNFDEIGGSCELQLREDLADAMLESPGLREAGGRCVIVSMKHHTTGVAKVVNPLGTVVTIQSDDDDADIDSAVEEIVIHENCDEALFRPVIASKAVVFAEPKSVQNRVSYDVLRASKTAFPANVFRGGNICDVEKSKPNRSDSGTEKKCSLARQGSAVCKSPKSAFGECKKFIELGSTDSVKKLPEIEPLDDIDFAMGALSLNITSGSCDVDARNTKTIGEILRPTKNDSICKEKRVKIDQCHAIESKELVSSSEENAVEEKHLPKKARKPKTKLGVRILDVHNTSSKEQEKQDDTYIEFTVPLPMKTWSDVAGNKKKSNSEPSTETESVESIASPTIQTCSRKSAFDEQNEEVQCASDISEVQTVTRCEKFDKCSDEEKPENTSSQAETTESDDSGGIKVESTAMDTEEDTCQPEIIKSSLILAKSGKKKSKKKRR